MSACPKIDFEFDDTPALGSSPGSPGTPTSSRPAARLGRWWYGFMHLAALIGFLGFCAFLLVIGLLWFSMAVEAG